jgi:hypothetical protein
MRFPALLLAAFAAAPLTLAAQPADPLPLRPGGPDVTVWGRQRCPPGAASAAECMRSLLLTSLPGPPELLSVDGRSVQGSSWRAARLLVGEIGTPVTLRYRAGDGVRTLRLARSDVYAPQPGFTQVLRTAHFVVHYRPADERRARSVAEDAERAYSRSPLPHDAHGRHAHLWVCREFPATYPGRPYPGLWGSWVVDRYDPILNGELFTYLSYGVPGIAGERLYGAGWVDRNTLHRAAVSELLGHAAWLDNRRSLGGYSAEGASLREYIRERYGVARLRRIWSSDAAFDDAVARTLGVSGAQLEADWRRHIVTLGPDPAQWPSAPALLGAFSWGMLLLLAGAVVARTREAE